MKNLSKKTKIIIATVILISIVLGGITVAVKKNSKQHSPFIINENIVFEYGEQLSDDELLSRIITFNKDKDIITLKDNTVNTLINVSEAQKKLNDFEIKDDDESKKQIAEIVSNGSYSEPQKQLLILKAQGFNSQEIQEGTATIFVNEKEEIINFDYVVIDTNKPTLIGIKNSYEYSYDEELSYITEIKGEDKVDGNLTVTFEPNIKKGQVGSHKIVAMVVDNNGNETTQDFTVVINEKSDVGAENTSNTNGSNETGNNVLVNTGSGNNNSNQGTSTGSANTGSGNNETKPTEPVAPTYACPGGKDKNRPCDDWIDPYDYMAYSHHSTMDSCKAVGYDLESQYWVIDGKEVTNFACTQLNNNGYTDSFYRLELMHEGTSGTYWLNQNKQWVQ